MGRALKSFLSLLFLAVVVLSCSGPRPPQKRFSLPDWETSPPDAVIKRLVVVATHNLEGQVDPKEETFGPESGKKLALKVGGIQGPAAYLNILRQRFHPGLLVVDTGRMFGPLDSPQSSGEGDRRALADFYRSARYDAILFTDRELSYMLQTTWGKDPKRENLPFVNSNILSLKSGSPTGPASERLFNMDGVKVGVMGVTLPRMDRVPAPGHAFEDPILALLRSRQALKEQGAQVFVLLAQVPNTCVGRTLEGIKLGEKGHQHPLMCQGQSDALMVLMDRLPPGSVDLVVAGGGPWAQGFHKGIPVVQAQGQANYLSLVELFFDTSKGKVLSERTRLFFPIKTCHQFVSAFQDCYKGELAIEGKEQSSDTDEDLRPSPARFLGTEVSF